MVAGAAVFGVGVTLSPLAKGQVGKPRPGAGDVALYRAEIERIRSGEGYYQAAATELPARGYPTRNVFNWRTPLPMWLVGKMPDPIFGKVLLCLLAGAAIWLAFEALAREDAGQAASLPYVAARALACVALLSGPMLFCVLGDLFVEPCLWAGVLIALSIGAYGVGRPGWGVGAGLAALFCRELALPYCLLGAALAWWQGRRKEQIAWVAGLLGWAVFFGLHCWRVASLIAPDARAHDQGWVQFGGAGFAIAAAQMNAYLLLMPQWVAALWLVAAMFGFAGWPTALGQRAGLTAAGYVLAFAFVGQEFNQYWGTLIGPLLCLGAVRLPASLADLWRSAAWKGHGSGFRGEGSAVRDKDAQSGVGRWGLRGP